MKFDITYYDFDRAENSTRDGHHCDIEARSATQAVLDFLSWQASYELGTQGREDYERITEVGSRDDDVLVSAYRDGEAWEVHVYIDNVDESFVYRP